MNRRAFLRTLLAGAAVTAAGVYVPKRAYSFLQGNPLAPDEPMGLLGMIDDGTYVNNYLPVARQSASFVEVGMLLIATEGVWRVVDSGDHVQLSSAERGILPPGSRLRTGELLTVRLE